MSEVGAIKTFFTFMVSVFSLSHLLAHSEWQVSVRLVSARIIGVRDPAVHANRVIQHGGNTH